MGALFAASVEEAQSSKLKAQRKFQASKSKETGECAIGSLVIGFFFELWALSFELVADSFFPSRQDQPYPF
jgi:hypothetical protein